MRAYGDEESLEFRPGGGGLANLPGVAGAEKFGEIAGAALGDDVFDLVVHDVFVAREVVPGAQNADGGGEAGAMLHVREQESVRGARVVRVMDDEVGFGNAVAELDDFDVAVGFAANAFVAVLAEDEGLTVFEVEDVLAASVAFGEREPGAVVEDVAVLEDFDEGGAFVRGGLLQRVFQMRLEDVHATRDESGFRADGQGNGIEGAIDGAEGRGLRFLVELGRGGILALGEAVDAVVEKKNL